MKKLFVMSALLLMAVPAVAQNSEYSIIVVDTVTARKHITVATVHTWEMGISYSIRIACNLQYPDCHPLAAGESYLYGWMDDNDPEAYPSIEALPLVGSIRIRGAAPGDRTIEMPLVYMVPRPMQQATASNHAKSDYRN